MKVGCKVGEMSIGNAQTKEIIEISQMFHVIPSQQT